MVIGDWERGVPCCRLRVGWLISGLEPSWFVWSVWGDELLEVEIESDRIKIEIFNWAVYRVTCGVMWWDGDHRNVGRGDALIRASVLHWSIGWRLVQWRNLWMNLLKAIYWWPAAVTTLPVDSQRRNAMHLYPGNALTEPFICMQLFHRVCLEGKNCIRITRWTHCSQCLVES